MAQGRESRSSHARRRVCGAPSSDSESDIEEPVRRGQLVSNPSNHDRVVAASSNEREPTPSTSTGRGRGRGKVI